MPRQTPPTNYVSLALDKTGQNMMALARALGVSPQSVLRWTRGGAISWHACIDVARYLGVPPDAVLRAHGHAKTADILARVLGSAANTAPPVTDADRQYLDALHRLHPAAQAALLRVIAELADADYADRRPLKQSRR